MTYRPPRGFTLLEMVVTLAILAVLMVISLGGLSLLKPRADLSATATTLSTTLTNAKQLASANGSSVWFGFIPSGAQNRSYFVLYESWDGSSDPRTAFGGVTNGDQVTNAVRTALGALAGANEQCPEPLCHRDRILAFEELPPTIETVSGAEFGSDAHIPVGFRVQNLGAVATGCSFCEGAGPGWVEFLPRGEVRMPSSPNAPAGVLVLTLRDAIDPSDRAQLVAISSPFGLVRRFGNE